MRYRKVSLFFIILLSGLSAARVSSAVGLSTTFADVVLENVRVGKKTPVRDLLGHELVITNLGSTPVSVKVEGLIPSKEQLKGDAVAIPETSWVSISPELLEIPAQGTAECHIIIRIPRDSAYKGKKYQMMIWSHSVTPKGGGVSIATGLLSRVRFSTKK